MKEIETEAARSFYDALDLLEIRAAAVGISKRELARIAGTSPATMARWRRRLPATIRCMARMEIAVERERLHPTPRRVPKGPRWKTAKGRIDASARNAFNRMIRAGKQSPLWTQLFGSDLEAVRRHIERQFLPGMTWENMELWHIDHIRPLALFSYSDITDPSFRDAWALTNLRPLWKRDNVKKGAKRLHLI